MVRKSSLQTDGGSDKKTTSFKPVVPTPKEYTISILKVTLLYPILFMFIATN